MKKRKPVLIAVIVIAGVLLMLNLIIGPDFARQRAELAFDLFRDDFEQAAQGESIKPLGVLDVMPHKAQEYLIANEQTGRVKPGVEFQTGAWGFGSQTSYFGIVYTAEDLPLGYQCVDLPLISNSDGSWYWNEVQENGFGDNWQRIVKLDNHWYFYEMHF